MLLMSSSLLKQPVMSLRTGTGIGLAVAPIIDPKNLKILGWWCDVPGIDHREVLLSDEVREIMPGGLAVNDETAMASPADLHRHREVLDIKFELIGKAVKTKRQRLGKVSDYSYDDKAMMIMKLYVTRSLVKIFTNDDTLLVDRSQILEITDDYILVEDAEVKETAEESALAEAAPAV